MSIIAGKSLTDNVKINTLINEINTFAIAVNNHKNNEPLDMNNRLEGITILLSTLIEKGYLENKSNFINLYPDSRTQLYPSKLSPYAYMFNTFNVTLEDGLVMEIMIVSMANDGSRVDGSMTEEFCNRLLKKISTMKFGDFYVNYAVCQKGMKKFALAIALTE